MATLRAGSPDGDDRTPQAHTVARPDRRRALRLSLAILAILAIGLAFSTSATAAGEALRIPDDYQHVIEGDSVLIELRFGVHETHENVTVQCREGGCDEYLREVVFDEQKANCEVTDAFVDQNEGAEQSERVCEISFPEGFENTGNGPSASAAGEPAHASTYDVHMGLDEPDAQATFDAHLSTASTCRPLSNPSFGATGVAQRTDVLLFSASGYPQGDEITIQVVDGQEVIFERTMTSPGRSVPNHPPRWQVPIDLPIEGQQRQVEVIVQGDSGSEREKIVFRPGVAKARPFLEPGMFDLPTEFNRTQEVPAWVQYEFYSAPQECREMQWDRILTPVTAEHVGDDPPNVAIRRHNDDPHPQPVQTVDTTGSGFDPNNDLFLVNYTIPKDEEATQEDQEDPVYDVLFEKTQLADGNYIGRWNSTDYEVYPYEIEPDYVKLQDEVERLETAELVVNLSYADGSPFTPDDAQDDLEFGFGPKGEDPIVREEANYRGDGIWDLSVDLDFDHEPLGPYTWRIYEQRDRHNSGAQGESNRVPGTITDVVDVLSARPRLNLTTIVNDEQVDGAQRTQRVQVRVDAHFQNGVPLTPDNIDPSLGGVVLKVDKKNEFGRVVDQDRFVMTHAGQQGTWIESFRVGRSPSSAPVGDWDLELVARDDEDPPNENITDFSFDVRPANLTVADSESPPPLVNGTSVSYQFRLYYPDGSLVSERFLDETRGGDLEVTLERVTRANQPPVVERELDPRPVSGGQAWRVELNASKIVPGNHFFNVHGEDIHGNLIPDQPSDLFTVLFNGEFRNSTTPICPERADSQERCDLQRGETVYVVFPGASGDKGMVGEEPEIRVHRKDPESGRWILYRQDVRLSSDQFFNLTGRDPGNNHVGRFTTDRSTPTDTYRLAILGRGNDDRGFAGFSQTFNVTQVPVQREIIQPLPATAQKTQELAGRIEHKAGDVIDLARVTVGPVAARNVEIDQTGVGTFVRWKPPSTIPTGSASIHLEGRDLFGNPFEVDLGPVDLQPVRIDVDQDGDVGDTAPRGRPFSFNLQMTYETGSEFTGDSGRPDVVILDSEGNEVDEGQAFDRGDFWQIRWVPDAGLPSGQYRVKVTGTDGAGNVVEDFTTQPVTVTSGTVRGDVVEEPSSNVRRGQSVEAVFDFPTNIASGNATVTTGTDRIGGAQTSIDGSTVRVSFTTTKSTELADGLFRFEGTDVVGNNVTAETNRFSVRSLPMSIEWVDNPSREVTTDETVRAAFVVQYPDGSLMQPGEGVPIVGLFAGQQAFGRVDATPLEENPAVWTVSWEPPEDARTDIPYHFSASARDSFRNEAPPTSSRGFFVQNPVVPEYVPTPSAGPWAALAVLAGLAVALRRRSEPHS